MGPVLLCQEGGLRTGCTRRDMACFRPGSEAGVRRRASAGGLLLVLALAWAGWVRGSILIDDFAAGTHDRFANQGGFVLAGQDLSGVGLTTGGLWGTLVSPNVVLSAWHYHPADGSTLVFYSGNDPGGASATRTVVTSQRIGTSDLWAGALNAPLPSGYAYYEFADYPITDLASFVASGYGGATAYMVGRSPTATGYGAYAPTDQAYGVNLLDGLFLGITVGGTTGDALGAVRNLSGDANYLTWEAFLQPGDSGGPLFTATGGGLELVGINWFIGQVDIDPGEGEVLRDISGFTYIGNYASTLQAFLDAHPVPEPSTVLLWAAAVCVLAGRRTARSEG